MPDMTARCWNALGWSFVLGKAKACAGLDQWHLACGSTPAFAWSFMDSFRTSGQSGTSWGGVSALYLARAGGARGLKRSPGCEAVLLMIADDGSGRG